MCNSRQGNTAYPHVPQHILHSEEVSHPYFQTNTTPPVFRRQLGILRENGLHAITLKEALSIYRVLRLARSVPWY